MRTAIFLFKIKDALVNGRFLRRLPHRSSKDKEMTEKKDRKKENSRDLNIYQKLVDVRREITYLQKSAKGHTWDYVKEDQILSVIRPKMDEHNLILEIDMENLEMFDFQKMVRGNVINAKGIRARFVFTWINGDNPTEQIIKHITLQDDGIDCKAIGGLLTYANRYFLLKYFSIPTDHLDPDSYQERLKSEVEARVVTYITPEQVQTIEMTINGYEDIRKAVLSKCNNDFNLLTTEQFPAAISWIKREVNKREKDEE